MRRYFPPANYCIYCGANHCRLTDEHIIPLALNGNLILPKSSCDSCAKVTTRFELIIARDMYGPMRIANNFQTRRKKKRSADIEGSIVSETGEESPMSFSPSLLPSIYMALDFPPPGILTGAPLSGLNPELKVQLKADPEKIAGLAKALDVGNIEMGVMAAWGPFSQLLAKIGHGYIEGIFRGRDMILC
ncbi:hypothetical protein [Methylibium sp. Pch-M]|uniref:hypothetical protein n=1 Tax=Methylibium sp. Pch-M TaxID=2082386 RepID=UPI001013BA29|nr:hypothetical protein [Methylibium sp. Pch-M]